MLLVRTRVAAELSANQLPVSPTLVHRSAGSINNVSLYGSPLPLKLKQRAKSEMSEDIKRYSAECGSGLIHGVSIHF
jgi:hypothetical protein